MRIVDFTASHIEQAARIAKRNYGTERELVPALPPIESVPDLTGFAESGLGVAALEGDTLLGFLCCWNPFDNAFGISGLRGVFSPLGANGTVLENRAKIYAQLYQAAGEKWARSGAGSHAVCLYAHDKEGLAQFFRYGFGARTVDAIRRMEDIVDAPPCEGYTFSELKPEDILGIYPLEKQLDAGYIESPFFMTRSTEDEAAFLAYYKRVRPTCYAAKFNGQTVAFIRAEAGGETFIQNPPQYLHCKGMYCLPEHRGKGIAQRLLRLLSQKLSGEGVTRLGVDYESINPSGSAFWQKHFEEYTYGLVRRIDDGAVRGAFPY